MKTFLKYFLFLFLLAAISVGMTLLLRKPKEQIIQQQLDQPAGSFKEFPQIKEADREEASLIVPVQPEQNNDDSSDKQDDLNSGEDRIKNLIESIKSNYALDNWNDIKTAFKWIGNVEGTMKEAVIAGQGFSADSNQAQIETIENFLREEGFQLDGANTESGANVSIKGFQKENQVCLVIKTTAKEINQFDVQEQSELAKLEMRCGLKK